MIVGMFSTGHVAIWSLILCGFANSIMYPTIFALGIAELGPLTSKGFRWSRGSAAVRAARRQSGIPARVPAGHRLLPLHDLLRRVGIQAGALERQLRFSSAPIHQALRRAGGLDVSAVCSIARAERSAVTKGVSAHTRAASLYYFSTQGCTIPRQRLLRIATWFACKRDSLNRAAAKAAQGELENMTKVIPARTDEPCGCEQAHPRVTAALAGQRGASGFEGDEASEKELTPWPSVF
jgi:hypothetical protein